MTLLLSPLAVALAAFCIWLMVRIVNRRERWAKWTLAAIGVPVLYIGSYAWTVDKQWIFFKGPHFGEPPLVIPVRPNYFVRLPFGASLFGDETNWGRLFAPVHAVDRQLRPAHWILIIEPPSEQPSFMLPTASDY